MRFVLIVCFITCFVEICQSVICHAEVGVYYPMRCSLPPGNTNFNEQQWFAASTDGSNGSTVITTCTPGGNCTRSVTEDLYSTLNPVNNQSTLMVNASRMSPFNFETTWSCQFDSQPAVNICQPLLIYERAKNVSCEYQPMNAISGAITCTIERIYPQALCNAYISTNNVSLNGYSTGVVSYTHIPRSDTQFYYSSTCTFSLLDRLFPGKSYITVRVFPYNSQATGGYQFYVLSPPVLVLSVLNRYQNQTTQSITTQDTVTVPMAAITETSNTALVIGLGVATGVCFIAAVVLGIVMLCYCRRNKKKTEQTRNVTRPSLTVIPEGYNQMDRSQCGPTENADNFYEDMNNRNVASRGGGQRHHAGADQWEQASYVNSKTINEGSQTSPGKPRTESLYVNEPNYINLKGYKGDLQSSISHPDRRPPQTEVTTSSRTRNSMLEH